MLLAGQKLNKKCCVFCIAQNFLSVLHSNKSFDPTSRIIQTPYFFYGYCFVLDGQVPLQWLYALVKAFLYNLVISKSKGLSEILPDIRASTYQIYRIKEKVNQTTTFN